MPTKSTPFPASHPICGVGAVIRSADRYLLVRRGRDPNQGKWAVPGGKIKLGETMRQAVAREVEEETGLKVEAGEPIWVGEAMDPEGTWHFILIDFEASVVGGDLRVGDDAAEVGWFTLDEARNLPLTDTMHELFESIK
jgi:ADP-ribose pyrophosphatase YjhB (NUDIX family)